MSSQFFETKKIRWRDISSDSYQDVSVILQNDNGPCPLIALVNTLILREPDVDSSPLSLRSFTNGKEQVSVNGLLEIMADLLLANNDRNPSSNHQHQDVHHVLSYLPKLVTGLNIDVRFNGSFVDGPEMALFRMYDIDPIHGWVCDPDSPEWNVLQNVGSYDESQSVLLKAQHDDKLHLAASAIQSFLSENPTQLTQYGLTFLRDLLSNNSLNILFRNDHFATSFMSNNKLYTLVTDSGYKNESSIVWQSLTSISGNNDSFYDSTFAKVDKIDDQNPLHTLSPEHDEDFLLARKLQEEDDSALAEQLANESAPSGRERRARSSAQRTTAPSQPSQPIANKKKKKDCIVM